MLANATSNTRDLRIRINHKIWFGSTKCQYYGYPHFRKKVHITKSK